MICKLQDLNEAFFELTITYLMNTLHYKCSFSIGIIIIIIIFIKFVNLRKFGIGEDVITGYIFITLYCMLNV